jgi:hypothetical protein
MWHACERTEKCSRFWWESAKERDHSEERCVDGRTELECIFLGDLRGLEWIILVHDSDLWRAVVNTMMNLRVLAPPS